MAPAKRLANAGAEAGAALTPEDVTDTPVLEDVEAAFSDVPEDATISLWRRQENTGKWGILDTIAPDMFSVKAVADKWGGGTYRALATAKVKGKPGRPRIANVQFVVDPAIDRLRSERPPERRPDVAQVLEASYVQALTSMMAAMQGMAESHRRPSVDWAGLATAVSPIVVALLQRGDHDPLEIASKLVELTRPDGKAPEFSELFDVFTRGLEFANDSRPDTLSKVADSLTQLIEHTATQEGRQMLAPGDTQAPPQLPTKATATPVTASSPAWLEALRPYLGYLVKQAAAGKDPELYAEWLADQLEPQYLDVVRGLVADPAYPGNVIAVLPAQVKVLAPWFERLCLALAPYLEEEAPPEGQTTAPQRATSPRYARAMPALTKEDAGEDDDD